MRRHLDLAVILAGLLSSAPVLGQTACPPIDTLGAWARVNRAWSNETGQRWSNDTLRAALRALAKRDQALREDFGRRTGDTAYMRTIIAADSALAREVEAIVDRVGIPTRSMVGAAGADAFMLVVQHNGRLQERVLALAKNQPAGQLSPQALAMLEDRVLVARGSPQVYGTQFTLGTDGRFRFASNTDLPGLAARRERAGLPPFDQYVCMMEEAGMRIERTSLPPTR